MADLKKFTRVFSKDIDINNLQDELVRYIISLQLKIEELEDRLEAGGL